MKELRERTGAGMMDCKKALAETNGEMEAAIDWLRAKGLSAAAKKAGRTAAEGLVGVAVEGKRGAVVEVNSETDFVAKNELFQDFVRNVAKLALEHGTDVEALGAAAYPGGGTVAETLTDNIAKIGENQSLRRAAVLEVERGRGRVLRPQPGRSGPRQDRRAGRARERGSGRDAARRSASRSRCMSRPRTRWRSTPTSSPAELIERERSIAMEKAKESGKPQNIVEKMVEGGLAKFRKENALLTQLFVMDNKTPVAEVVASAAKDAGTGIELIGFVRFQLGEGIEKKESDFAAEVAAAAGTNKAEPVA